MKKIATVATIILVLGSNLNMALAVTQQTAYRISVVIPEHVQIPTTNQNNNLVSTTSNKEVARFDVLTQEVIRDNKPVLLQTITTK